ncbi:MAG: hypothetical protein WC880_03950 [Candidatus Paceibacterota bacterium]
MAFNSGHEAVVLEGQHLKASQRIREHRGEMLSDLGINLFTAGMATLFVASLIGAPAVAAGVATAVGAGIALTGLAMNHIGFLSLMNPRAKA